MDDSGAILCQISSFKDMLDQVNDEIEQNIHKTREIESEIVKCPEIESDYVVRESEMTKVVLAGEFELNCLIQVAANMKKSLEALESDLRFLKTNIEEISKRIEQKREKFILLCFHFQSKTLAEAENGELSQLLSLKEAFENEKTTLNTKINALQNSTREYLDEILEELQISNSALDADIQHGESENTDLLKDISELGILLSSICPSEDFSW